MNVSLNVNLACFSAAGRVPRAAEGHARGGGGDGAAGVWAPQGAARAQPHLEEERPGPGHGESQVTDSLTLVPKI